MSAAAKRPVPHIQHTPEIEAAACAVVNAKVNGKAVVLCENPLDIHAVRTALGTVARSFEDPAFWFEDADAAAVELSSAENIILLATLLREHLKAGNST